MLSSYGEEMRQLQAKANNLQARNNRLQLAVDRLREEAASLRREIQRLNDEALGWHAAYSEKCDELEACQQGKEVDSGG